jgi:polyisoprenoid-binding protein YceI
MPDTARIPSYIAGKWSIDPVHSHVSYSVRHFGIGRSLGRFESFHGTIVTAENPLDSTVTATIDTTSLSSGQSDRDAHMRGADFLDAERFPTATFRSTGIREEGEHWIIDGELTIRGVTKPVSLTAELGGFAENPYASTLLGVSATTTFDRTDFGIGQPGGATISEKVTLTLDIEATLVS